MINKKLELKRLVIFLFLTFSISWIPAIIFNKVFGYHEWFETNKYPILFIPVGYAPALANIITRKITNEGWHDSMLHLKLKANIKYYIIAIFIVSIISILNGVFTTVTYGKNDWSEIGLGLTGVEILSGVLPIFSVIPLLAFNTIGEEFGWRGYMNQKMEPLIGTTGTIVVGGVIWGLWHAVLTVEGHNFGTDYDGYPYLGILYMCIFCTFTGIILMWITKKTGSIYPAAIIHAMNNFGGKNIGQFFISGVSKDFDPTISQSLLISIPGFVVCTFFMILLLANNSKSKKSA